MNLEIKLEDYSKTNVSNIKDLVIIVGETRYNISKTIDGELLINKFNLELGRISITPGASNSILIK